MTGVQDWVPKCQETKEGSYDGMVFEKPKFLHGFKVNPYL